MAKRGEITRTREINLFISSDMDISSSMNKIKIS
jgi:hypothetical protein